MMKDIINLKNMKSLINEPINAETIKPNLDCVYMMSKDSYHEGMTLGAFALLEYAGAYILASSSPIDTKGSVRQITKGDLDGLDLRLVNTNIDSLTDEFLKAKNLKPSSGAVIENDYGDFIHVEMLAEGINGEITNVVTLVSRDSIQRS